MVRSVGFVLALLGAATPATAGELRLSFQEIAGIAQKVIGDAKITLNNKPGFLGITAPSTVTFAGKTSTLPLPVTSFPILDSRYAYYVTDIGSTSVRITGEATTLRVTIAFESSGPELVGACVSGPCRLATAMPQIEWADPSVTVDFVPVLAAGSVAFEVKSARLNGDIRPVCRNENGGIVASLCNLALPYARSTVARFRKDMDGLVKQKVNDPEMQATIAQGFKPYLTVGALGTVEIQKVTSDAAGVRVGFRLGG